MARDVPGNLPAVVLLVAGALVLVPESRDPAAPRLDWRGCVLSFSGLSGVVWADRGARPRRSSFGRAAGEFAEFRDRVLDQLEDIDQALGDLDARINDLESGVNSGS